MPPRHVRAREFKRDEKIAELAKERKESKKASASRKTPIDPAIPSWKRGFYTAIDSFLAGHEVDIMVAGNIATEARNDSPGTIVAFQANASGNDASTNGASM
uniref:Uncharacterized protein n=1 Tax=Solanum tuberosum TaxID=4113 RepID=M1DZY9_SOLTU